MFPKVFVGQNQYIFIVIGTARWLLCLVGRICRQRDATIPPFPHSNTLSGLECDTGTTPRCSFHKYYNYHWYTTQIPQIANKLAGVEQNAGHILDINNNNMAKDWDTLEVLFGGNCTTSPPGSTVFHSKINSVTKTVVVLLRHDNFRHHHCTTCAWHCAPKFKFTRTSFCWPKKHV